jgi:hypothetical protein
MDYLVFSTFYLKGGLSSVHAPLYLVHTVLISCKGGVAGGGGHPEVHDILHDWHLHTVIKRKSAKKNILLASKWEA